MASVVVMPKAGNSVESCILLTWNVAVGDTVEDATILCEAETDKSTIEVPAGVGGTVLALIAQPGDEVPVMEPIAIVGAPGESFELPAGPSGSGDQPAAAAEPAPAEAPAAGAEPIAAQPVSSVSGASTAASPYARTQAAERGIDWQQLAGSGPHGRVIARDIAAAPATTRGVAGAAVPAGVSGTGLGGRITREDVAAAAVATPAAVAGAPAAGSAGLPDFPGAVEESRLTGIRKIVSERMMHSRNSTAPVTYTASAPATALLALRARLKSSDPSLGLDAVTLGDLVNFAAVRAAARRPMFSAHLEDGVLRVFEEVHLGMAVDTPRGLLVPTVRFAGRMGLRELSAHSKDLIGKAQAGTVEPDLLTGGTFTVSNLGAFGIESFSPIINAPQTAILGVDAITVHAAAGPSGELIPEQRIGFSLTADHRVIDGADAARYLKDLTSLIAAIDLAVIG
ncbi:MAG: dihydrolipoamide acetyltransferase family protein [Tetrasphaera sp.]